MSAGAALTKGGNATLEIDGRPVSEVVIGLGWEAERDPERGVELDVLAFVVDEAGVVLSDAWFVFYANPSAPDGAVRHLGEELVGRGAGDREELSVRLDRMPPRAARVVMAMTIFESAERERTFRDVHGAFIRVADAASGAEIACYRLDDALAAETAMILGELYRRGEGWRLRAVGQGYSTGVRGLCADHGVRVG